MVSEDAPAQVIACRLRAHAALCAASATQLVLFFVLFSGFIIKSSVVLVFGCFWWFYGPGTFF